MWTFAQNAEKNRVEITFAGGFGRQHDAFDAQLMAMAKRLMIANGHFDCLVDMSRSEVAPRDVTERGAGAIRYEQRIEIVLVAVERAVARKKCQFDPVCTIAQGVGGKQDVFLRMLVVGPLAVDADG